MPNRRILTFFTTSLLATGGGVFAQDDPSPPRANPGWPSTAPGRAAPPASGKKTAEQLVHIQSTADVSQVGPGETFRLAFIFDIEPEWHIYWKNSGASGSPTQISITAPQGFTTGKTLFPRPIAIAGEEGVSFGYDGRVVLFVEMTAPAILRNDQVTFTARINYMVCKGVCMLGRSTQMVNVQTRSGDGGQTKPNPLAKPIDPIVADFKKRLPQPMAKLTGATAAFEKTDQKEGNLTIRLPAQGFSTGQFFPVELPGVTYDQPLVRKEGEWIVLTAKVTTNPNDAMGNPMRIVGTAGLGNSPGDPAWDIELTLPQEQQKE